MRLIDGDELYKAMKDAEDLARQRVLDTESTLPYPNNLNPSYTRYLAQMDERTKAKHMIADAPAVDAIPVVQCKDCKHWRDIDGVYRRGVGAKSKCPINLAAVYKGTFYCGFGERKDGEHDRG